MMHIACSDIKEFPYCFLLRPSSLTNGIFRLSVRMSVCPSVCHTFSLCYPHHIIMKFSGVITKDQSKVHPKGQGQRSKVKVTEVKTQLNGFWTVTPVWIHIWWCNDAHSLVLLRRGSLLFCKVIRQISRPHGSKFRRIWSRLGVSGLFEFTNGYEMMHKAWSSIEEVSYCFSRSNFEVTRLKNRRFRPKLGVSGR